VGVLQWKTDIEFGLGDTAFRTTPWTAFASSADEFVLAKERDLVEYYVGLVERVAPRNMIEIGIFQGGSIAFFAALARPHKLVALELDADPAPALRDYIAAHGLDATVRPYYGVDQSDAPRLQEIVREEFGDAALDLVVDDASHLLEPTRASFNALFPRVRPGGLYVIEDWALSHLGMPWGGPGELPLTILGMECLMVAGTRQGVIDNVEITPYAITVQRGPAELDPATFAIGTRYDDAARSLVKGL
jgi:hypothetical protein